MKTQIMRDASHLLHPPGGEVVRDLLDNYDDLLARYNALVEENKKLAWGQSNYDDILARYNALQEAVAWERETSRFWEFGRTYTLIANDEALKSMFAARAEVDRLLEEDWN